MIDSYDYMRQGNYFVLLYKYIKKEILNWVVYIDVCSLIDMYKTASASSKQCKSDLGSLINYNIAEVVSILVSREFNAWSNMHSSPNSSDAICSNLVISMNEVVPAIIATFQGLIQRINITRQ